MTTVDRLKHILVAVKALPHSPTDLADDTDIVRGIGLDSIELLSSASRLLAERCVDGIEANRERNEQYAESTLAAATALNPFIGYDKASEIVKEATASGRPLREVAREAGVDDAILDEALDYHGMAKPHG